MHFASLDSLELLLKVHRFLLTGALNLNLSKLSELKLGHTTIVYSTLINLTSKPTFELVPIFTLTLHCTVQKGNVIDTAVKHVNFYLGGSLQECSIIMEYTYPNSLNTFFDKQTLISRCMIAFL